MVSNCIALILTKKEVILLGKIKVAMCDDLEYLCKYFRTEINANEDMECVTLAHNSAQCIEMVKETKPDILLLDIQMETNDAGINVIPKILSESPQTKIIVLTIHESDEYIFRALTNGAIDYLIKTSPLEEILA